MVTESEIRERLRQVIDPELGINIVDLGLIYEVIVATDPTNPPLVVIRYTLTTPACPLADTILESIEKSLANLPDFLPERDLRLELTFDPPWNIDRLSESAKAELGF